MVQLRRIGETVWVNPVTVTLVRGGGGDAIIQFVGGGEIRVPQSAEDVAHALSAGLNAVNPA